MWRLLDSSDDWQLYQILVILRVEIRQKDGLIHNISSSERWAFKKRVYMYVCQTIEGKQPSGKER